MEDHDEDPGRKQFEALFKALLGAYMVIETLLEQLPMPIRIPPMDLDWEPAPHMVALNRVRALVQEEPVSRQLAAMIDTLILDWLATYDLAAVFQEFGPAPWRMDAAEASMTRVAVGIQLVRELQRRTDRE